MPVLMTSDLKRHTGKILDAARKKPQFVVRNGSLFVITLTEPESVAPRNHPPGYFNDPADDARIKVENAFSSLPQAIDR
jgi:hypothetical protein